MRQQPRLERHGVDAATCQYAQAGCFQCFEIPAERSSAEYSGVTSCCTLSRCGFQQDESAAGRQVSRQAPDGCSRQFRIQYVLQDRDADDRIERAPQLQRRQVGNRKRALRSALGRTGSRQLDHVRTEVDPGDAVASRRQLEAPAPDTATHVQRGGGARSGAR